MQQHRKVLVIDIGGSHVKFLATGQRRPRRFASGKRLTPDSMVQKVLAATRDWRSDVVSLGYPGLVNDDGPHLEPANLGKGWVGFDFSKAFRRPVRVMNDAAMQALGSYEGGRMLFLGLGTGLGSTLIAENTIVPLELGQMPHKEGGTIGHALGKKGLERLGKEKWTETVKDVVAALAIAFVADYVVLGGGNAKKLNGVLPSVRLGHNLTAFRGGLRLWNIEYAATLAAEGEQKPVY